MSCGIVRSPPEEVLFEIVFHNCQYISDMLMSKPAFSPMTSSPSADVHNLSKRLSVRRFHLFCPEPFISPPLPRSHKHPPPLNPLTHTPPIIHPPHCTSVAERGIKGWGTLEVEQKNHQWWPPAALHFLHQSPLDLWAAQTLPLSLLPSFSHLCEPPALLALDLLRQLHSSHSMQLLVVLAALMGVLYSVRAASVLPVEDRSSIHLNRVRKMLLYTSYKMYFLFLKVINDRFDNFFVGKFF